MTKGYDVFIGSYGTEAEETIHWLQFDPELETFKKMAAVTGIDNPSFVIVNNEKTHLYAVSEVDQGEVVSYQIDYENHMLRELNRQPTKGGPCFLEMDAHDRYLFTANYGGGSVIVHPVSEDGKIGTYTDYHEYDSSQQTSHAHAIKNIPGTSKYVATDLGHDKLSVYKHEEGELTLVTELQTAQDAGPRHIAFQPDLQMMYILNQDDSTIIVYTYDGRAETFELVQIVPTLLDSFDGKNYSADIHISGSYLYASNRGHHSMTTYKIKRNGRIEALQNISSGGEWPRNFAVVPNEEHIIVANEHTDHLVVMKMLEDGQLENTANEFFVSKPVCVRFI